MNKLCCLLIWFIDVDVVHSLGLILRDSSCFRVNGPVFSHGMTWDGAVFVMMCIASTALWANPIYGKPWTVCNGVATMLWALFQITCCEDKHIFRSKKRRCFQLLQANITSWSSAIFCSNMQLNTKCIGCRLSYYHENSD